MGRYGYRSRDGDVRGDARHHVRRECETTASRDVRGRAQSPHREQRLSFKRSGLRARVRRRRGHGGLVRVRLGGSVHVRTNVRVHRDQSSRGLQQPSELHRVRCGHPGELHERLATRCERRRPSRTRSRRPTRGRLVSAAKRDLVSMLTRAASGSFGSGGGPTSPRRRRATRPARGPDSRPCPCRPCRARTCRSGT